MTLFRDEQNANSHLPIREKVSLNIDCFYFFLTITHSFFLIIFILVEYSEMLRIKNISVLYFLSFMKTVMFVHLPRKKENATKWIEISLR